MYNYKDAIFYIITYYAFNYTTPYSLLQINVRYISCTA